MPVLLRLQYPQALKSQLTAIVIKLTKIAFSGADDLLLATPAYGVERMLSVTFPRELVGEGDWGQVSQTKDLPFNITMSNVAAIFCDDIFCVIS